MLILGKGITALGVMRTFGRRRIPLYVLGASRDLVTRSRWYRPLPGGPAGPIEDCDLEARLNALDVDRMVLLPASDGWATSVSALPRRLSERFPHSVAPPEVLRRLVDKACFTTAVCELEIPHPRTTVPTSAMEIRGLPRADVEKAFLKPTQSGKFASSYGPKALRFRDLDEACSIFEDARSKGFQLMFQEFIPGPADRHHFVEGYLDRRGRVCGLFARRRLRMYPAEFGNSTSTESVPLSSVAPAVESLLRLLSGIGYTGIFSAEFKHDDRDGLFKILEVNARPWWYVGFAAQCGVDVCGMAYRDALGEDVAVVRDYFVGLRCLSARLELEAAIADWRSGRLRLSESLRSWVRARQLVLAWDDPTPGLTEFFRWGKRRLLRTLSP